MIISRLHGRGSVAAATLALLCGCGSSACPPGTFDDPKQDALGVAAASGNVADIIDLVQSGADPNAQGDGGFTALMCAQHSGHDAAFGELLQLGANLEIADDSGRTALWLAVVMDDPRFLKIALEHGADPNTRYRGSNEPILFNALVPEGLPRVSLLVAAGADVNATDVYGVTALNEAVSTELYDIALYLLEHGADPTTPDRWGQSALSILESHQPVSGTKEAEDRQLLMSALVSKGFLE